MASELDPRNPFRPAGDAAWSQRLQQIYSSQAKFNNVPCAQRQVEFSAGFKTLMMELSNFHVMKSKSFDFPESRSPSYNDDPCNSIRNDIFSASDSAVDNWISIWSSAGEEFSNHLRRLISFFVPLMFFTSTFVNSRLSSYSEATSPSSASSSESSVARFRQIFSFNCIRNI